jgi:hypothetical protein
MTKKIEETRTFYPENDPYIDNSSAEELTYGWERNLTLKENILAYKDMSLNQWWVELPLEIKESLHLFSADPNIFIVDQFVDDYWNLEDKSVERELLEFEHGYEEQQERLKSKVIKLREYKPDDKK